MVTHGGNLPGFSAQISYLPIDGVGLVALINGDGKYKALLDIQNRVYMDTMGLKYNINAIK
jgi:hypothetical protein